MATVIPRAGLYVRIGRVTSIVTTVPVSTPENAPDPIVGLKRCKDILFEVSFEPQTRTLALKWEDVKAQYDDKGQLTAVVLAKSGIRKARRAGLLATVPSRQQKEQDRLYNHGFCIQCRGRRLPRDINPRTGLPMKRCRVCRRKNNAVREL